MRLIDADMAMRKIREYMEDYPNAPTRLAACRACLSILGDKQQVPTIDSESLRPISRKQVEKMRGEWRSIHGLSEYYCSRCGEEFEIYSYDKDKYKFCPYCMSPMTEDAVDILWKRLEALNDGKRD